VIEYPWHILKIKIKKFSFSAKLYDLKNHYTQVLQWNPPSIVAMYSGFETTRRERSPIVLKLSWGLFCWRMETSLQWPPVRRRRYIHKAPPAPPTYLNRGGMLCVVRNSSVARFTPTLPSCRSKDVYLPTMRHGPIVKFISPKSRNRGAGEQLITGWLVDHKNYHAPWIMFPQWQLLTDPVVFTLTDRQVRNLIGGRLVCNMI